MVNNQSHWRQGQAPQYRNYSGFVNGDSGPHPNQLPPFNFPPIQQGNSLNDHTLPRLGPYSPHVLPIVQTSHILESNLRPSIHQPILSRHSVSSHNKKTTDFRCGSSLELKTAGHDINSLLHGSSTEASSAALYLEEIKRIFENQIEVYNQFVNILTELNSQRISTPRVIEKIISLLEGHPNLIIGFNTFLPPGYKILPSLDPNNLNDVRVVLPARGENPLTALSREDFRGFSNRINPNNNYPNDLSYNSSSTKSTHYKLPLIPQHNGLHHTSLNIDVPKETDTRDFERAVNHINRVKTYFNREPDKYSLFLSYILKLQHEQSSPKQIYELVQDLLGKDSEIFKEFCQFIPGMKATSEYSKDSINSLPINSTSKPSVCLAQTNTSHNQASTSSNHLAQIVKASNLDSLNSTSKSTEVIPPISSHIPVSPIVGNTLKKKRTTTDKTSQQVKSRKIKHIMKNTEHSELIQTEHQTLVASSYQNEAKALTSPYAVQQFEKIRKHLNNQTAYNEFLKILNVYSQEVIENEVLVSAAEHFIGNNESLFKWFKEFVGLDTSLEIVTTSSTPKPKLDLTFFRSFGPSYRQLPKSETMIKCSGRDELCQEVLNDEFASHPTWASEETVFVAHKKNAYEENLHKSEEDRYELDYNMETIAHTISLLEPINRKVSKMNASEATSFKLQPGLGGASLTIYKRAIRQVYDNEAQKVLDLLYNSPASSVPVVLKRLKLKDQEWRENKKEWFKIWKDLDVKNYYRSLDYQTTQFKCNDRKTLNPRYMVTEVEAIKSERDDLDFRNNVFSRRSEIGNPHMSFTMDDLEVHKDTAKVILSLLGCHTGLSLSERKKIATFLKSFIKDLFNVEFMDNFDAQNMEDNKSNDSDKESYSSSDNEVSSIKVSNRVTRSKLINSDVSPKPQEDFIVKPDFLTESVSIEEPKKSDLLSLKEDSVDLVSYSTIKIDSVGQLTASFRHPTQVVMFSNCHVFAIIQFYQILYSRLKSLKIKSKEASAKLHTLFCKKTASRELDLHPKIEALADIDLSKVNCYQEFLNLTSRFVTSEIDQATFEDCLRFLFGNHVYNIFTIDKIIGGLCKQVHMLFLEPNKNSLELVQSFQALCNHPDVHISLSQLIDYHSRIQKLFLKDENVFLIEYSNTQRKLTFQLFEFDDLNSEYFSNLQKRWLSYTSDFALTDFAQGLIHRRKPFLSRLIKPSLLLNQPKIVSNSSLTLATGCPRSFQIRWVAPNSCESFIKQCVPADLSLSRIKRNAAWEKLLNGPFGWSRNLSNCSKLEAKCFSWLKGNEKSSLNSILENSTTL